MFRRCETCTVLHHPRRLRPFPSVASDAGPIIPVRAQERPQGRTEGRVYPPPHLRCTIPRPARSRPDGGWKVAADTRAATVLTDRKVPVPTVTVLCGDDPQQLTRRRRALLAAAGGEQLDIDLTSADTDPFQALQMALRSASLFATERVAAVAGFEQVTAERARQLAPAVATTDATVVAVAARKPHPAVVAAFDGNLTVLHLPRPTGRQQATRVADLAEEAHVTLPAGGSQLLLERCDGDLQRIERLLSTCAAAQIHTPQLRQLALLAGAGAGAAVPWQVTDAIAAGDTAAALTYAGQVDPHALAAHVAGWLVDAATLAEVADGTADGGDPAAVLGRPAFQTRAAARAARVGTRPLSEALLQVADATAATRTGRRDDGQLAATLSAVAAKLASAVGR